MEYNNFTDKIVLEPVYETEDGLEFIDPNDTDAIQKQLDDNNFQLVFQLQTVDCACVYGILNQDNWMFNMETYMYLRANPYNKITLYKLLTKGEFDIGVARLNTYHLIRNVMKYYDEANSEIRLHYSKPRSFEGNVAWRSLNWDLFEDIVNHLNQADE
jgi:hypothetical protein